MRDILNIWEPILESFQDNEKYTYIAERMKSWSPYDETRIIIEMDEGYHYIYDMSDDSLNLFLNREETEELLPEEEWLERFGRRLCYKMKKARISQGELSEMTGISKVSISKYMNGRAMPSAYNIKKIARCLGCYYRELTDF